MKNLVYQYYIPYEAGDKDIGGASMPDWALSGSASAKSYAAHCGADYMLSHDRLYPHLDPRLESLRLIHDPTFEQYDHILSLDLDMIIATRENIFELPIQDIAMAHELGVFTGNSAGWINKIMNHPMEQRGIRAYGRHLFGSDWDFPKSTLYPQEQFRYMNGGLQLWSAAGRLKARENFRCVNHYYAHTRYTEQMYINLQLSQPMFNVTELDTSWNRLAYQWPGRNPDGKINHFLGQSKSMMSQYGNLHQ
jgi:hypothetical protein